MTAVDYHRPTGMLVVGFSNGIFDLFEVGSAFIWHVTACMRVPLVQLSQLVQSEEDSFEHNICSCSMHTNMCRSVS